MLKLAGAGAGSAVGLSLLAACGSKSSTSSKATGSSSASAGTQTITDMAGKQVEVPTNPTAYADGWYAHNEVTIMLTGAKGLVATHCDPKKFPWMYKVCPNMSKATSTFGDDFNFEDLAALNPQVIFDSKETLRDKAKEVGIPVVNCMFQTYEDMKKSITMTAQVFGGDAPKIAEKYNAELDQTVKDVKAKTDGLSDEQRPTVMHGNSVYTLNLDGTGTIIDEWIKTAGGRNAVTETTSSANAQFTMEQILAGDPDVIITGKAGEAEKILADPNWASIKAVQNQKVYVNPKGVFGWDRYGVEELLQVQWVSALLHPDLFPDLKIEEKVKTFYKTYLNYSLTDDEVKLIMAGKDPQ
ncbi:Fe3+-hydroxamate ABC transporter substrate-binding protein [Actinomyces oris]|uniref:Fe3+-hydroxamate ABC transporter substrate-binding protein n=1 Tax=Actinomyces oris TaxID=544580 RepID=A0A1Q8VWD7_9ACTO|nr:Fe3+-hydroxamate ABC transporter substrate-binding protein [Actinomyces oris]